MNTKHTNGQKNRFLSFPVILYQMSDAFETGVWLTISGETNSGVPYLQYWASSGVITIALPKSQIRI